MHFLPPHIKGWESKAVKPIQMFESYPHKLRVNVAQAHKQQELQRKRELQEEEEPQWKDAQLQYQATNQLQPISLCRRVRAAVKQ